MSELTKKALTAALVELMKTKSFDKISVKDLADRCGVNRQTFYYHFVDIRDLLRWIVLEDAERVLQSNRTAKTWEKGYLDLLKHLREEKDFVSNVFHSLSLDELQSYLYKITYNLMKGVVDEESAGMSVREEDKSFIADFLKYAFVGVTLNWIKKEMKEEPPSLVEKVSLTAGGLVSRALSNYRLDK